MLKLLFIPTGNIFTLPDTEALKIKSQDRANEYRILDAGFQKEEEPVQISQEEVKSIVKSIDNKNKANDILDEVMEVEEKKEEASLTPLKDTVDLETYTKEELVGWCRRFNIKASKNDTKPKLIQKIIDAGINI